MAEARTQYLPLRLFGWRNKQSAPDDAPVILAQYHFPKLGKFKKLSIICGLLLFCFVYGFFFSVIAPYYFVVLVSPLVLISFLVIWVLPDTIRPPVRILEWLFYAMFVALAVWPNYLAIALPGLPWITMIRLTSFPMLLALLVCLSVSFEFRRQITHTFRVLPSIPILLSIFVAIQLVSIGLSKETSNSIQKFIIAQTTWTASFVVAAYLFSRPGQIRRWSAILWAAAVFVSVISILEYRVGHVLWVDHIPSFLKIEDETVQRILSGTMRSGTTRYRSQATFSTPLGLAEFIALALPFVLHFVTARFSKIVRVAAIASVPILLYGCYLTDAKLGMVGCLIGLLVYGFAVSFQNWRKNRQSLVAAAVTFSYPAGLLAVAAAVLFVGRFKNLILGDGSHANSTSARITQYTDGLQRLLEWPFGYGIGMSASTLDFGTAGGFTTIDTYYLTIALEYGVAGFVVYYGMFALAVFEGGRRSFLTPSQSEDRSFLLPITVSLTAFAVIKSVFSQQDNHPVVFMMLGALTALIATSRRPTDQKGNGFRRAQFDDVPTRKPK